MLVLFLHFFSSRLEISFDEAPMTGVACNLDSRGFHVLCKATKDVVGHVKPYSITGSLPLIRELQVQFPFLSSLISFSFFSVELFLTLVVYDIRMKASMFKPRDMVFYS